MEALLAFAASLLALRLAGRLLGRWRERRAPELAAWAASLGAYAVASAALAWGAAAGWDEPAFRVYYLCGGLLTAPLLGLGSLLLAGRRFATPIALVYVGLAAGVAASEPLRGSISGSDIPDASHFDAFPARVLAVVGNVTGTLAVLAVAAMTMRARPLGNALIVAGVVVAAAGSALFGTGVASTAVSVAVAAVLLYAGFVAPRRPGRALHARVAPEDQQPHAEQQERQQPERIVPAVGENRVEREH
jgi:hypothetical protein